MTCTQLQHAKFSFFIETISEILETTNLSRMNENFTQHWQQLFWIQLTSILHLTTTDHFITSIDKEKFLENGQQNSCKS